MSLLLILMRCRERKQAERPSASDVRWSAGLGLRRRLRQIPRSGSTSGFELKAGRVQRKVNPEDRTAGWVALKTRHKTANAEHVESAAQRRNEASEGSNRMAKRVNRKAEHVNKLTERVYKFAENVNRLSERVNRMAKRVYRCA